MKMNKKGNLTQVAFTILFFLIAVFLIYKIGSVLLSTETAGSLTYNQTEALLGDNGAGLLVDLAPIAIIGLVIFGGVLAYMKWGKTA